MFRKMMFLGVLLLAQLPHGTQVLASPSGSVNPTDAPIVSYALARGRELGQKENWKGYNGYLAATKYILVTLGGKAFTYTRDGKLIKFGKAVHPSAGIVADYAETGWEYLDKNEKIFSDTLGHYLMHKT